VFKEAVMRTAPAVLSMLVLAPFVGAEPAGAPTLPLGVRQIQEGQLSDALVTLDAVVRNLTPQAEKRRPELIDALVYKGWALVGLGQEEPAKASFRAALQHDPALRLAADTFPDRVIRVFEAARKGDTKSVLERPTGISGKKAGLGAGAIALIAGGAALAVAGGTAAATGGGEPTVYERYYGRYQGIGIPSASHCDSGNTTLTLSGKPDGSDFRLFSSRRTSFSGTGTIQADGRFDVSGFVTGGNFQFKHTFSGQTDGTRLTGREASYTALSDGSVGTVSCTWDLQLDRF
jgi:hypothetical protein